MNRALSPRHRLRLSLRLGAIITLLVLLLWGTDLFAQVRLLLADVFFVSRPVSGEVVIVAIDDASLTTYGRFSEWPRSLHASLVETLSEAGARVIAFDILFAEAAPDDDRLARAIADARQSAARTRVVLPLVGVQRALGDLSPAGSLADLAIPPGLLAYAEVVEPAPLLRDTAMLANVNVLPDGDGVIRWLPTFIDAEGRLTPTLAVAAYLSHRGISSAMLPQVIRYEAGALQLPGERAVPVDDAGRMLINYFSTPEDRSFPVVSFADVLAGAVDPAVFADRIVFVGLMEQTALTDSYPVPNSRSGLLMAGVEIQVNALETLLQNLPLTVQPPLAQGAVIVVLTLLASLIYGQLSWRWMLMVQAGLLLLIITGGLLLFNLGLQVTNLLHPLLGVILPAPATLLAYNVIETRQRERIEFLLRSALTAADQRLSLSRIAASIADDLSRLLRGATVEVWLREGRRDDLTLLVPPQAPGGRLTPEQEERRAWAETALAAGIVPEAVHVTSGGVVLPLLWQEEAIGALVVLDVGRLTPVQRDLLARLAWQSALLLVNANLYAESEQLSDFKTHMLRMASHDLKNPLARIIGYGDLLQMQQQSRVFMSDEQAQFLTHMLNAADDMNLLITEVLNVERARRGSGQQSVCDIGALLREAVERARPDAEVKDHTLSADVPTDLPRLQGDSIQLQQVFANLLSNAIKYTPHGGRIDVRAWAGPDYLRVEVEDDGLGIAPEAQRKLFQEFYRVRTDATAEISGTGLGLSLVKVVVEAHGGRVWVESQEGQGSTFFVELPLRG